MVETRYEEKRTKLKETLKNCLELSREMLNEDIGGYEDMPEDYSIELFVAIKNAKDAV